MITFSYDPSARIRTARFEGTVNDAELMEAYRNLLAQPDYDPTLDDLVDLRPAERLEVSSGALLDLVMMYAPVDEQGIRTRLAMVAGSPLAFGMSRMYELLRGPGVPEDIRVFNTYDEAVAWLGRRPGEP